MRLVRILTLVTVSFGLAACGMTHVEKFETTTLIPREKDALVMVFLDEAAAPKSYVALGSISHFDLGKYQRIQLEDVLPVLKDKARTLGANGIIINDKTTIYSGIISRGISVKATAIKY